MGIEFKKVSDFNRGILYKLLKDAYSFNSKYQQFWNLDWQTFDNFFFDNLQLADKYGFITTLNAEANVTSIEANVTSIEAIGFVSWDPRNMPEYVEIGFNCLASKYKGKGYGKMQLKEAVNRISKYDVKKIIVTTNDNLVSAQQMYESVGFTMDKKRNNQSTGDFAGEYIDYVYLL